MTIIHFFIFVIISLYLLLKDPYWGVIIYLAAYFFRFQEYVPQLEGISISIYIIGLTALFALFKGAFGNLKIDGKFIVLILFLFIINIAPIIQDYREGLYEQLIGFGCFYLLITILVTNTEKLNKFVVAYYLLLVFLAITLFHSYYVGDNYYYYWHHERPFAQGPFENPTALVPMFVFGVIFSACFFNSADNKYKKILHFLGLSFFLYAIMLCASRSGIFQLIIAVGMLLLFLKNTKSKLFLFIILFILSGVIAQRAGTRFWARMAQFTGKTETGVYEPSAQERLNSWRRGIEIIKEYPFLGIGTYNITKHNFRRTYDGGLEGRVLHSGWLEIFAENGIIGGMLWILLIILSIKDLLAYRLINNSNKKKRKSVGLVKYSFVVLQPIHFNLLQFQNNTICRYF